MINERRAVDIVFLDLITTYDTGPLLTNKLMQPGLVSREVHCKVAEGPRPQGGDQRCKACLAGDPRVSASHRIVYRTYEFECTFPSFRSSKMGRSMLISMK